MANLDLISNINIVTSTLGLSQIGFGTPLLADFHNFWPELTRTYTNPSQLLTDGVPATHALYLTAATLMSQQPHPPSFKVGRLGTSYTQTIKLTPYGVANGKVFTATVYKGTTTVTATVTASGVSTVATICTALVAALGTISGVTITDGTTYVGLAAAAGTLVFVKDVTRATLRYEDVTTDPGIAADLAAIRNADSNWYALCVIPTGKAILKAASDWAETQLMLMSAQVSDYQALDSASSVDLGATLKAASQGRTVVQWRADSGMRADAALLGKLLPTQPGSETWMGKTLTGITVDVLSATELANLRAKNYVTYAEPAQDRPMTLDGKVAGGEFVDMVRFVDWLKTRMQERIVLAIANNPKIPYTAKGLSIVESLIRAQLLDGVTVGGIDGAQPITVTVPDIASIPTIDKTNRVLNNVTFRATPAGAIHFISITGTLSF